MSLSLSKARLMEIVGGRALKTEGQEAAAKLVFRGVEFDSRAIKGGELFVALPGELAHGNKFAQGALQRGATLVLAEEGTPLPDLTEPERVVLVKDSLKAFWALANWWRKELKTPIIAVTGSVGKTTIKEILASILMRTGQGVYSLRSHNNHVGVPYTLCRLAQSDHWGVIEMGMNHPGEIEALSRIVEPDVGVITTVAPAHIEFFRDIHGIVDAKLEIVVGMPAAKTLVINGDNEPLMQGIQRLPQSRQDAVVRFGSRADFQASVSDPRVRGLEGISFTLSLLGEEAKVDMSILGIHNAMNSAAAALAAKTLLPNLSLAEIVDGLQGFRAPLMRMNVKELSGGRIIVDDSYNANPASMAALLELGKCLSREGRKVGLIIGDMRELGSYSERYHLEASQQVASAKPSFVVAVGSFAGILLAEAEKNGIPVFNVATPEDAAKIAQGMSYDILLVKASRTVGLDRAVKVLEQAP